LKFVAKIGLSEFTNSSAAERQVAVRARASTIVSVWVLSTYLRAQRQKLQMYAPSSDWYNGVHTSAEDNARAYSPYLGLHTEWRVHPTVQEGEE
jgi:hypothetical protein